MAIIFDGKKYAFQKEGELAKKVAKLKAKGITPRLEGILDSNQPASRLYLKLKKASAQRIGAVVGVYPIAAQKKGRVNHIKNLIKSLNADSDVHGIMVQLPLSHGAKLSTKEILETIALKKDVDGLREKTLFQPAVVKAVLEIIDFAKEKVNLNRSNKKITIAVVGAKGMVGKPLAKYLKKLGYKVIAFDVNLKLDKKLSQKADILISATGRQGVIKGHHIKEGTIVIDVGSPKPDVSFNEVVGKASFITPVPGGVGPVTVVCLLENVVYAAGKIS